MSGLPVGWAEFELGTVFEARRGRSVVPAKEPEQQFELYSVPSFPTGVPERSASSDIGSAKQAVAPDTVLLCRINPRINRVWLVGPQSELPQIASTEWVPLKPVSGIASQFTMLALRTPAVRRYLTANVSGVGGSLMRVRMAALWQTRLPLAPLPEQHRIVARIEDLFAKLDVGVAALKRAQVKLERYRASVLKAAVEGTLTEQWRKENPPMEGGEELLRRILAERRQHWEDEQLAKFAAARVKPPKNWKKKYKEPVGPDTSKLPELPDSWCWTTVDQIGRTIGGLTKNPARRKMSLQLPYLRVANVYADELRLDDVRKIGVSEPELDRASLLPGDILVVEGNGSADQIGRVALWDGAIAPCVHQNHLIKIRLADNVHPRWALIWLLSPAGRSVVLDRASSTSGLHTLSLSKVRSVPIPLPPRLEQAEAERITSSLRDFSQIVERWLGSGTTRASILRSSILKRAFDGRLIPQDPNDEPASVLLGRIRAEQEAERKKRRRRPTKPKRTRKSDVP